MLIVFCSCLGQLVNVSTRLAERIYSSTLAMTCSSNTGMHIVFCMIIQNSTPTTFQHSQHNKDKSTEHRCITPCYLLRKQGNANTVCSSRHSPTVDAMRLNVKSCTVLWENADHGQTSQRKPLCSS